VVVTKTSSAGSGTIANIYLNGVQVTAADAPFYNYWGGQAVGRLVGASNVVGSPLAYFGGGQDEIRVSNVVRSADWIKTEYNSQSSPSTFFTVGQAQSNP
jgi:hypothetical protein